MDGSLTASSPMATAEAWLRDFGAALAAGDACAHRRAVRRGLPLARHPGLHLGPAHDLFRRRHRRPHGGLRWHEAAPRAVALAAGRTPPRRVTRAGVETIEAIFTFETSVGPCNGVVRLVSEGGETRAWTLMTALDEIRGHEDPANGRRWQNVDWKRNFGGENWLDRRKRRRPTRIVTRPCSWWARRRPDFASRRD